MVCYILNVTVLPKKNQYPPAKTPCIDATYFQRSPNKQLKSQCLNSHAHTLRRTFFCPRSPCFPSFVAPQEHTPQCQQKLLLPKKTSSISKIRSITLQWSGFNQSPGFKKNSTLVTLIFPVLVLLVTVEVSKNTGFCFWFLLDSSHRLVCFWHPCYVTSTR